jgi:hypothetical protein
MLLFVGRFYEGMSHLIRLAVPLFVFLGLLIEMTGMARAMVSVVACPTSWWARCISCPVFPDPRRPTWRPSRPHSSPR